MVDNTAPKAVENAPMQNDSGITIKVEPVRTIIVHGPPMPFPFFGPRPPNPNLNVPPQMLPPMPMQSGSFPWNPFLVHPPPFPGCFPLPMPLGFQPMNTPFFLPGLPPVNRMIPIQNVQEVPIPAQNRILPPANRLRMIQQEQNTPAQLINNTTSSDAPVVQEQHEADEDDFSEVQSNELAAEGQISIVDDTVLATDGESHQEEGSNTEESVTQDLLSSPVSTPSTPLTGSPQQAVQNNQRKRRATDSPDTPATVNPQSPSGACSRRVKRKKEIIPSRNIDQIEEMLNIIENQEDC